MWRIANIYSTYKKKNFQQQTTIIISYKRYSCNFAPLANIQRLAALRNHKEKEIQPKMLLDLILTNDFRFSELHASQNHEFTYGQQDQEKLTALLLLYYVSYSESDIDHWPSTLPTLPHTVANNWRHFCRQFQRCKVDHCWKEGPPELDKYIGIAKDLVNPVEFGGKSLRQTARNAYTAFEKASKNKNKIKDKQSKPSSSSLNQHDSSNQN